ncbi:uncharacterized protein NFIA_036130 [Aspergillus fischeri NRRL 181]|uniref:Uncharacterized protein n=1 Tax=Neosartorya fischeri (strain ATCC 1020 / DSM 3700 / CBS 544.65 / FGSC A1164 / JCM 1740 / NRRL 181 / WB 181) TaxID=331117 RepID=A1CZ71_NEOFI|nr:uncharacterized protein NFIA_036130 [Aspergillus fischeri NRRL 181]EAW24041.1 hypothetical protein NFIA_036130 [Aspergillus fischeri NRRL 181]
MRLQYRRPVGLVVWGSRQRRDVINGDCVVGQPFVDGRDAVPPHYPLPMAPVAPSLAPRGHRAENYVAAISLAARVHSVSMPDPVRHRRW